MTTPPQDEYTSKLAETLERVRKIEEETIPQMRGDIALQLLYNVHACNNYNSVFVIVIGITVPYIEFIMTQYSTRKENNDRWYSPPFYTGPGGYKMCISVNSNGFNTGTGTHVSVYVHLMRGEYDSRLVWPFKGDITIQLVNHNDDHLEKIVPFNDAAVAYGAADRVTSGDRATKGRGYGKFVSHTDVESSTSTRRYIDNNSLTFRITKVEV